MMGPSMKEKTYIRYNKIWRRKEKQEEQLIEKLQEIILIGLIEFHDHDESTSKDEDVKIQNDNLATQKDYILF
jgi:hypothetical protein